MQRKKKHWIKNIICDNCGYQNKDYWVKKSGICNGCGKVLNEKAYFIHQMRKKLHIVKGKGWREF